MACTYPSLIRARDSRITARQLQPLPAGGGQADRTLVLYGQSITYFSQWLVEQGLPANLSSLTRDNVLGWLDALRARGLTAGTVRTRWRGLRRFVNWLVAEDIITNDPLVGIVVDKPEPPPVVPVFTDEELTALVGACPGSIDTILAGGEPKELVSTLRRTTPTPRPRDTHCARPTPTPCRRCPPRSCCWSSDAASSPPATHATKPGTPGAA